MIIIIIIIILYIIYYVILLHELLPVALDSVDSVILTIDKSFNNVF
jgi:hypothetical protein